MKLPKNKPKKLVSAEGSSASESTPFTDSSSPNLPSRSSPPAASSLNLSPLSSRSSSSNLPPTSSPLSLPKLSSPKLSFSAKSASIQEPLSPLSTRIRHMLPAGKSSSASVSIQYLDIPLVLTGSSHQWGSALSDLGFTSVKESAKKLELEFAESLDLQGKPHQFIRLILEPKLLRLQYTQETGQHPIRRKLQALQLALLSLSVSGAWHSSAELHQQLAQALSEALALVSEDADALRLRAESAEKQVSESQARLSLMEAQREADSKRQLVDTQTIQALQDKIRHLEHLPDSVLDEELMEWLLAHDGQVNVYEVSRSVGVVGQRVEDALDRLCKAGRIRRIG